MAQAVVIGGGPTGLATAMLLARQGLETVVVDRDPEPPDAASAAWDSWERRSVTQFHQVHLLQAGGRSLLQTHLPAVIDEMASAGVPAYNVLERLARALPDGPGDVDFGAFETRTTCRRPFMELGFVNAARRSAGVEVRHGTAVTELLSGPSVVDGVPHVTGVKTETGETISADVVVDAAGRRTPVPGLLESIGAQRPLEHAQDVGFVYNTRYYRGAVPPEYLATPWLRSGRSRPDPARGRGLLVGDLVPLPKGQGDAEESGTPRCSTGWSARLPLHAHWVDGEATIRSSRWPAPPTPPGPISSTAFRAPRVWCRSETPGDSPTRQSAAASPSGSSMPWVRPLRSPITSTTSGDGPGLGPSHRGATVPWHDSTVEIDRVRGPEVEAFRLGLPTPTIQMTPGWSDCGAFGSAIHYDAQVLAQYGEIMNCKTLPLT